MKNLWVGYFLAGILTMGIVSVTLVPSRGSNWTKSILEEFSTEFFGSKKIQKRTVGAYLDPVVSNIPRRDWSKLGQKGNFNSATTDQTGNLYAGGYSITGNSTWARFYIVKYTPQGEKVWEYTGDETGSNNVIGGIAYDPAGFVVASGYYNEASGFRAEKINAVTGTKVWEYSHALPYPAGAANVVVGNGGMIYVGGSDGNGAAHVNGPIKIFNDNLAGTEAQQDSNGVYQLVKGQRYALQATFGNFSPSESLAAYIVHFVPSTGNEWQFNRLVAEDAPVTPIILSNQKLNIAPLQFSGGGSFPASSDFIGQFTLRVNAWKSLSGPVTTVTVPVNVVSALPVASQIKIFKNNINGVEAEKVNGVYQLVKGQRYAVQSTFGNFAGNESLGAYIVHFVSVVGNEWQFNRSVATESPFTPITLNNQKLNIDPLVFSGGGNTLPAAPNFIGSFTLRVNAWKSLSGPVTTVTVPVNVVQ